MRIDRSIKEVTVTFTAKDLSVIGIKKDGTQVTVFEDGNFIKGE